MATVTTRTATELSADEHAAIDTLLGACGERTLAESQKFPGVHHYLIWLDEKLVAHASWRPQTAEHQGQQVEVALVQSVAIAHEGLGRQIIRLLRADLNNRDYPVIVAVGSAPSALFLEHLGWLPAEQPVHHQGQPIDQCAVIMPLLVQQDELRAWLHYQISLPG